MRRGKALRLAGFVVASCASVALVATAVETTGAYFTDQSNGTIVAKGGHLNLNVNASQMQVRFAGLMPGATPTPEPINYNVSVSSGTVDVWLTFDAKSSQYNFFTGGKYTPGGSTTNPLTCVNNDPTQNCGGLGRYAFFAVSNTNSAGTTSTVFKSGNLSFADSSNTPGASGSTGTSCSVNSNGDGGSYATATAPHDTTVPYCGVPAAILVASNLSDGASGTVGVSFGLTKIAGNNDQNAYILPSGSLPFHLVATQHNVRPDDPSNQ
jgi:hypothetical protein